MKEPKEPTGLAWIPILILPDGSVEAADGEGDWYGYRECCD